MWNAMKFSANKINAKTKCLLASVVAAAMYYMYILLMLPEYSVWWNECHNYVFILRNHWKPCTKKKTKEKEITASLFIIIKTKIQAIAQLSAWMLDMQNNTGNNGKWIENKFYI